MSDEQSATEVEDDTVPIHMNLTMHGEGEVTLTTMGLGLKPQLIITVTPSEEGEPDALTIEVDGYAMGTSKDDIFQVGNLLELICESIKAKTDEAYVVAIEGQGEEETDAVDDAQPDETAADGG